MRIFHRVDERFFLVGAAVLTKSGCFQKSLVVVVARFEARGSGARRRTHGVDGLLWEGKIEWPIFAAQEAGGGEGLELFAFADVEALAHFDEGGGVRIWTAAAA